jgi:hypothetical protein
MTRSDGLLSGGIEHLLKDCKIGTCRDTVTAARWR